MAPHSGCGDWAPRPRKPTAEMSRMAADRVRVVWATRVSTMFGKMARRMIRKGGEPSSRLAMMYSFCISVWTAL